MTSALITPTHIAILLVILLLLFGAKRVPETGRALGQGMREFKDAITGRAELQDSQPDCWKKTQDERGMMVDQNRSHPEQAPPRAQALRPSPADDAIQDLELSDETAAGIRGSDGISFNYSTVQVEYGQQPTDA